MANEMYQGLAEILNDMKAEDNGYQSLSVTGPGVVALVVPTGTRSAVITNPGAYVRIAFNVAATANVGTKCAADSNPAITSAELLATASVYWEKAAPGAFIQYYK